MLKSTRASCSIAHIPLLAIIGILVVAMETEMSMSKGIAVSRVNRVIHPARKPRNVTVVKILPLFITQLSVSLIIHLDTVPNCTMMF